MPDNLHAHLVAAPFPSRLPDSGGAVLTFEIECERIVLVLHIVMLPNGVVRYYRRWARRAFVL